MTMEHSDSLPQQLAGMHGRVDAPVFRAPWEAQVFALTVKLHEAGCFTWSEWSNYLGAAIADAQTQGDADRGDTYYLHWLHALERVTVDKGLLAAHELALGKAQSLAGASGLPRHHAHE